MEKELEREAYTLKDDGNDGVVSIADDVVIGANAVVVKSIEEPGVTVAGNPARIVSRNDSYHYLNR